MKPPATPVSWPVTSKRADGVVVTVVGPGRLTTAMVERFFADVTRLVGPRWLIDATAATNYDVGAIPVGSAGLRRLREQGLARVVAIVVSPVIRMGASVVALSAAVPFVLVASRAEAEAALARPLP